MKLKYDTEQFLDSLGMPSNAKVIMMKAYARNTTEDGRWRDTSRWDGLPDIGDWSRYQISLTQKSACRGCWTDE
jgi:hypothetical protein